MYFSIANQPGISEFETNLNKAEKLLPEIQNNLEELWKYDIACSVIFLVFICYFAAISRKIVYKNIEEEVDIEDFSVVVKEFDSEITSERVREHFFNYEISEVSLARNFSRQFLKYKKRHRLYDDIKKMRKKWSQEKSFCYL